MSTITDTSILSTMKWLKFEEAMIYTRMSKNTLKKHIMNGNIYATKRIGEWRVDRESIDSFLNRDRDNATLYAARALKGGYL